MTDLGIHALEVVLAVSLLAVAVDRALPRRPPPTLDRERVHERRHKRRQDA